MFKKAALAFILGALCAVAPFACSEPSPKMRELERTHLFSGKVALQRVLDVDLGVVCYVMGNSISCLQVSKIPDEEE